MSDTEGYHATTANFQWLIKNAINHNFNLRALGNGWSFSEVAVCHDGLIDTKSLRLAFWMHDSFIASEYLQHGKSEDLFFVQCGVSIFELHNTLRKKGRSMKACGGSNGQSVVGGFSTGTHGAAFEVGAIHDSIVGMHIITGPDRHVWIERASDPVASPEFIDWLGAELVRDDAMFHAAVISFGSFGLVNGVMMETDPLFLLEEHRLDQLPYNEALVKVVSALDFSELAPLLPVPLNDPVKKLYHLEMIINPHHFKKDNAEQGVYVRLLYKMPYRDDYPRVPRDDSGFMYGDDTLGVIETALDTLGAVTPLLVPPLVNKLFPLAFKANGPALGTLGEIFINTRFRGKAASAATAIAMADIDQVLDLIIKTNSESPFPGALACRFVKGTKATLGFTRFEHTCVLEMDGVDAEVSKSFFRKVWQKLEVAGIPFTLHWGKLNFILNEQLVRKMYGDAKVDSWISCRHALMDEPSRKVFTNNFMQQCGLDK
jgi:FAD/FMN-containing dehydrogenase